jgi:hypothetical protein
MPPMEHLMALNPRRSRLLLKNLLSIVSMLQKNAAVITSNVPKFSVNVKNTGYSH